MHYNELLSYNNIAATIAATYLIKEKVFIKSSFTDLNVNVNVSIKYLL